MKPGDVILIRFPRTDLQVGKLRPALVVAESPGRHNDLLIALITSRLYQAVPQFDEVVEPTDSDYSETGLKARSVIRVTRLASVETSVIEAKLGNISTERRQRVRLRIADWLRQ